MTLRAPPGATATSDGPVEFVDFLRKDRPEGDRGAQAVPLVANGGRRGQ